MLSILSGKEAFGMASLNRSLCLVDRTAYLLLEIDHLRVCHQHPKDI